MSKREIYTDDITGAEIESANPVKITMDGKTYTLDLGPESVSALTESFSGNGTAALAALIAPAPAPVSASRRRSTGGRARKGPDERNAAIREWVASPAGRKALGLAADAEISTRGRLPSDWADAYDAAHAARSGPESAQADVA
jgi:hypothetical protein